MPFAGFENFSACLRELRRQGKSDLSARRICGALQARFEDKSKAVMGRTSVENGHSHLITVDTNGDGSTSTDNGHLHIIERFVILEAKGHVHTISKSELDKVKAYGSGLKRTKDKHKKKNKDALSTLDDVLDTFIIDTL